MQLRQALWIAAAIGQASFAETNSSKSGTFCWPMHYAGVVVGTSQDKHVVRLLGEGAHLPNESEGVRYFVSADRSMTMKVSTFTDTVVGELEIAKGVDASLTPSDLRRARTSRLQFGEGFGKWHALKLGSTRDEVLSNLGPPAKETEADEWVFNAECTCELPEYFTIFFHAGKVQRVVFSAPPG